MNRFLARPEASSCAVAALDVLTDREREVVTLVAEGLSNDEIAERIYVSPLTVRTHVQRAMHKLGARHRAQLVVIAFQSGLVRVEPPGQ
ncbi:response regulator transcription factor [Nocardia pseudovaccinii]|uniref:response regulator transcription factor n=1 Tax=Nocardia pseudovaccinii TaxID=189540 RepID=UPI00247FF8F0|nr:response regulator transcription factor [Nocardia pseudovaccinii]